VIKKKKELATDKLVQMYKIAGGSGVPWGVGILTRNCAPSQCRGGPRLESLSPWKPQTSHHI